MMKEEKSRSMMAGREGDAKPAEARVSEAPAAA